MKGSPDSADDKRKPLPPAGNLPMVPEEPNECLSLGTLTPILTQTPTPLSPRFRNIGLGLILGGGVIGIAGASRAAIPDSEVAGATVAGAGLLIASAGIGFLSASIKPQSKHYASADEGGDGTAFRPAYLAEELRGPFLRLIDILTIGGLTVAPIIVAWLTETAWPLVGLLFPAVLVTTLILATLAKKYRTVTRAFISQLSGAGKKEFLDALYKHKH